MSEIPVKIQYNISDWRGLNGLSSHHQLLFGKIIRLIGQETMKKVWALYIETGLINKDGTLWGDKNADGTSKGPVPHSFVVALCCYVLAQRLGLNDKTKTLLMVGLTHDAYKRQEMENLTYPGEVLSNSSEKLKLLFGEEISNFANISSHSSLANVVENLGDLVMEIFYWADNAVVGATLQSVSAKSDYLEVSAKNGRYPFNEDGIAYWGVPYFTFVRYLGSVIEASLSRRVGVAPTTMLYKQVEEWITELE